jgi:hypothetical protein
LAPSDGVLAHFANDVIMGRSPLAELDYALLKLQAVPERGTTGASTGARVPIPMVERDFVAGESILILQHPMGAALKMSLGSVVDPRNAQDRTVYTANTERGSSGAPCFDSDLRCVALHHWGDTVGNSGVLASKLKADWDAKGLHIGA